MFMFKLRPQRDEMLIIRQILRAFFLLAILAGALLFMAKPAKTCDPKPDKNSCDTRGH